MKTYIKPLHIIWFLVVIFLIGSSTQSGLTTNASQISNAPQRDSAVPLASYPTDPTSDIEWSAGTSGVSDIQAAFNAARTTENSQLGKSIPMMTLPPQTTWNAMSSGEKALWLINRERIDRGVAPLENLETNVNSVAQTYANYLLSNDAWGHYEDGYSPWERLENNATINACHDYLSVSENLAVFVTTGSSISLPIERSIFMWMYDDGSCCSWGHRHAVLWYPYNDNGGAIGNEGFLGIGRASGGPYQGPFTKSYNYAELIVMNVFDPCSTWVRPTFSDVPASYWSFSFIETLAYNSVTSGCGDGKYCPADSVTRAQMAVFLLRAKYGASYLPPTGTGTMFKDVLASNWAVDWIEQLAEEGITSGCGGGNYCPNNPVTRAQMAVFLLRAKYGNTYFPPGASGTFKDVPLTYWAVDWVEQLAVEGITSGCGSGNFCPDATATRAQMAVFLTKTFNLTMP